MKSRGILQLFASHGWKHIPIYTQRVCKMQYFLTNTCGIWRSTVEDINHSGKWLDILVSKEPQTASRDTCDGRSSATGARLVVLFFWQLFAKPKRGDILPTRCLENILVFHHSDGSLIPKHTGEVNTQRCWSRKDSTRQVSCLWSRRPHTFICQGFNDRHKLFAYHCPFKQIDIKNTG